MRMPYGRGGPGGMGRGRGGPGPPGRHGAARDETRRLPVHVLLRRFWPFVRPYRWPICFGTGCVIAAAVLQKIRPLILRFLVDRVLTPAFRQPWSEALYANSVRLLLFAVGAMIAVAAAAAVISRFRTQVMRRAGASMVLDLRVSMYQHLQKLSMGFYESRQTGEIMSRVTGDVGAMERLITHVSDHILTDVLNLVVTVVILFWLSWRLTLVALLPVPLIVFLIWRFARLIRPLYREIRDRFGAVNAKLQDNIAGIRVIKAFHTEPHEAAQFQQANVACFEKQLEGIRLWAKAFPLLRFVQTLGHIFVTAAGGYMLLQREPIITLGDLFAFNAYVVHLYSPIGSLFRMYNSVLHSLASGERVLEILDETPEVHDAPNAVDLPPVNGQVRFEHVSFRYSTGEQVLDSVDIEARPGDVVALVGRSGAGKTSIVNLIPRFYDPEAGRVIIDGHDVKQVTQQSLRQQIAIVLQDAFLFNGTVLENIRYGRPDANDDEIRHAAAAAHADEFIRKLPDAYDTEIGERGVKLSGGQKQRISIARALLADRRILILDEATSMVDTESEVLIQAALAKLMEGRTTFVIAHRLSTVRNATTIVVLENGHIVETGDHAALLARNGVYAHMYQTQFQLALDDGQLPRVRPPANGAAGLTMPDLSTEA